MLFTVCITEPAVNISISIIPPSAGSHQSTKNGPSVVILNSYLLHGTVYHPPNFRPICEILQELKQSHPPCKYQLSKAILANNLLHSTVHHATKFQAYIWNPTIVRAVTFFRVDSQTDKWTDRHTDRWAECGYYPSTLKTTKGKKENHCKEFVITAHHINSFLLLKLS